MNMELFFPTRDYVDADVDGDAVHGDGDDDGNDDGVHPQHLYTYHPFHLHPPWASHRHPGENCTTTLYAGMFSR